MNAPRVLLVESLDAPGSDRADARDRCAALRALKAVVRVAVLHPGGASPAVGAGAAIATSGATAEWDDGPAGLSQLREFAREGRFDLILVAAASPGGGPAARALRLGVPVLWWPTGLPPATPWRARFAFGRGADAAPLAADPDGSDLDTPAGLAWSSVGARPAGRGRLTLWDGEYLLAPLALAGEGGSRLLAAFAGLAGRWCGLDLVVLAEPHPVFEREARARGVGPRVHFVGHAPREAEWAWWVNARGAVMAGSGPVSGGLLLRGLKVGCPIMVVRDDRVGATVRAWLTRHGGLCDVPGGGSDPGATLSHMVERGTTVQETLARGRVLAAAHDWSRLAARLAAAIPALAVPATQPVRPAAA